jgi:hypothetical protein
MGETPVRFPAGGRDWSDVEYMQQMAAEEWDMQQ